MGRVCETGFRVQDLGLREGGKQMGSGFRAQGRREADGFRI